MWQKNYAQPLYKSSARLLPAQRIRRVVIMSMQKERRAWRSSRGRATLKHRVSVWQSAGQHRPAVKDAVDQDLHVRLMAAWLNQRQTTIAEPADLPHVSDCVITTAYDHGLPTSITFNPF